MRMRMPTAMQISDALFVLTCLCHGHGDGAYCPQCKYYHSVVANCTLVDLAADIEKLEITPEEEQKQNA